MADNAVIGALRVVLGADSAQLEDGFKKAQKSADDFGKGLALAAAAVGTAIAAMATALGIGIKHTIDQADALGKTAQKIGVPVEELSKLRLAAELSGVGMDALSTSIGKLSKNMVEAAAKPFSEAGVAFRALGVSVTNADGTLKSASQVVQDVAGKFETMKDGAGKTAVAIALFGKAGKDMIPLLNAGRDGLKEAAHEAELFGIVIDSKTSKAAEAFNDNLTRLGKVKEGIVTILTAKMLPALQSLSDRLVQSAKDSDVVGRVSSALVTLFEGFARGVMLVSDNFGTLVKIMAVFIGAQVASTVITAGLAFVKFAASINAASLAMGIFEAIRGVSLKGILIIGGILALVTGQFDNFRTSIEGVAGKVAALLPEGVSASIIAALQGMGLNLGALTTDLSTFGTTAPAATAAQTNFNFAAMAGKTAVDQFLDSTNKNLAAQTADTLASDLAVGSKERLRVVTQALAIAQANKIPITDMLRQKISEMGNAAELAAQKMKGAQLVQEAKEPHEKYRAEIANNELALRAFGATTEQIAEVQKKTAEKYAATWDIAGASIAGSFAKISGSFSSSSKGMAIAAKVFGAIQATISMFTGAAKALELPFPANLAAMASVLATGAGLVASIRSQTVPTGMKTGGSFMVPGGMGGGDRKMIPIMAEPGEQVDVWRPGEAGGIDPRMRANGDSRTVTIKLEGENFGQKSIRKLIEGINEALGDGARLRMA